MTGIMQMFLGGGVASIPPAFWSTGATTVGGGSAPLFTGNLSVVGNAVIYTWRAGTIATELSVGSINNTTGAANWAYKYDAVSTSDSYNTSYTDSNGNSYLFFGRSYGGSATLIKVDSTGTVAWARLFGSTAGTVAGSNKYASVIAVDSASNIYLGVAPYSSTAGITASRLYKLDSSGTGVWTRLWTDTPSGASNGIDITGVAVDSSDNVIVYGTSRGSSPYFGIVLKYNSSGTLLSSAKITASSGSFNSYFGSGTMAVAPSSGNIYIASTAPYAAGQITRPHIIKLNSSFALQWAKWINGGNNDTNSFAVDSSENIYWVGGGGYGQALLQLDTSGSALYSQNLMVGPTPGTFGSYSQDARFFGVAGDSAYIWTSQRYFVSSPGEEIQLLRTPTTILPPSLYPSRSTSTIRGAYPGYNTPPVVNNSTIITSTVISSSATTEAAVSTASTTTTRTAISSSSTTTTTLTTSTTTGSYVYAVAGGSYTWIAPAGVTSASAVVVGGGGGTGYARGGGGGALAYRNNFSVTPLTSYSLYVGAGGAGSSGSSTPSGGCSWFSSTSFVNAGGGNVSGPSSAGIVNAGTGYSGGASTCNYAGGGGAGGYSGTGGNGNYTGYPGANGSGGGGGGGGGGNNVSCGPNYYQYGGGTGGGVGILGQGSNGGGGSAASSGTAGSNGYSQNYGGGGSSGGIYIYNVGTCCETACFISGSSGGPGVVRIIWPGNTRTFPSTNTGAP